MPRYDLPVVGVAIGLFAVVVCVAALAAALRAENRDPIQALHLD